MGGDQGPRTWSPGQTALQVLTPPGAAAGMRVAGAGRAGVGREAQCRLLRKKAAGQQVLGFSE